MRDSGHVERVAGGVRLMCLLGGGGGDAEEAFELERRGVLLLFVLGISGSFCAGAGCRGRVRPSVLAQKPQRVIRDARSRQR